MKKFKKSLSVFLALLFLMTSMPVVQFTAAPVVTTKNQETEKALPVLPDGYSFSGRTFIDEYDNTYYYIESEPSEYGLVLGHWIDEHGNKVDEYADSAVWADDTSDKDPVSFPSSYDARDYGYITPVEDQIGGTCWAHAAAACIEANAIKKGIVTTADISEYHTVWYSQNGYFEGETDSANDGYIASSVLNALNAGGNVYDVADAMLNFAGAASESKYPMSSTLVTDLAGEMQGIFDYSEKYTHDIVLKNVISCKASQENIKNLILEYGAAYYSYYSDSSYYNYCTNGTENYTAYYYPSAHTTNHAITVVGWDDNFSTTNFAEDNRPSENGAWLIKNSWGTNWGNSNGYFWISYEDKSLYSTAWAFDTDSASDYENVYMYDGLGSGRSISAVASANVFTAASNEYITKVGTGAGYGFYDNTDFNYTVKIYKDLPSDYTSPDDGTLAYTQTGSTYGERYIDITGSVELVPGEIFSVVLECSVVNVEGSGSETVKYNSKPNESFYQTSDGVWHDSNAAGYNNTCVRVITDKLTEGPYTVKFTCPGKYKEKRTEENGIVELPATEGYTWTFLYDGKAFDGTGVDRDMTVETHCYKTAGEISPDCVCTTEYKCIFCSRDILPPVTVHDLLITTIAPTADSPGYNENICKSCGYKYKDAYKFYDGAVGGTENGFAWQIVDGVLSIVGTGSLPDYSSTVDAPWYQYDSQIKSVIIGEDITRIGDYCFRGLYMSSEISFPLSLEEIGEYAFMNWMSLKTIEMPENLKTIDFGGFFNDAHLKEIKFNDKISSLGWYAFGYCSELEEAVIPGTLSYCGSNIYYYCDNIKRITVEEGITSLNNPIITCTYGNSKIEEIIIPSTVKSISSSVFKNLYSLKNVTVSPDNETYCSVDGIVFNKSMTYLYYYPSGKDGVYYKVPDEVSVIGSYAFNALQNLKFLDMSCAAVSLPAYTIYNNYSLTNIILPSGLSTLRSNTLYENRALSAVYVPSAITTVESKAVYTSSGTTPTIYTDSESAAAVTFAQGYPYEYVATHTSHSFDTLAYGKDPDCVNGGETIYTCECGQFAYSTQPCTGIHTYEWVVDAQPSCTETGTKHQVCTVCAATASVGTVIPANGHTKIVTKQAKDATCTENGNTVEESCSVCGAVLTASTVIPSKGHTKSITKAAKEATCTETGYTAEESCSVCGIVLTESTVIPMKEHTKVISKPAKDATCTETGYTA
ncbi:MAG: leucine-rich repeat protein, partial [Firmicutes bacterium]|nr:leucine-rich repeat protein [Bacillota bacterium]